MTVLSSYWPSQEETNRCIKAEAETASDAVLLAVHQQTPLAVRNAASDAQKPTSERELLDAFLTRDLPEGTLLLAITGASGAGKSHVIRWLAAQLGRDPRAANMHVIRIPKSANLKTVVELILEPLEKNGRFAKARKELQKAVSAVKPKDGAIRFAAELELALGEQAEILTATIRENPGAPDVRELRTKLDHAKRLPGYFSDTALQDHFKGKILPKIVERAVVGRVQDGLDAEPLPQFSVDDLTLPETVSLGDAARDVRTYYQTILNRSGGKGYEQAVEVLNAVIDTAIRNVFHLNQAMGGVTVEEVVLQIRSLLMEEGKELVLLIEDFAALSGIQEVLLNVCIQEAIRDGKKIRAPMRTALAVTDGYLASRDTILTRAKREWVIQSTLPNEEEVLSRTIDMVGAYLNAARWGEEALQKKLKETMADPAVGLTGWVTAFEPENESLGEAEIKRDFGRSRKDIPLFPFNKNAIEYLIEEHLKVGGRLQFNPRRIINYIIRETLKQRNAYENGIFPPPDYSDRTPKADVARWLIQTGVTDAERKRLGQLIVYWGGNPESRKDLGALSEGLFSAFGLPAPTSLGIDYREPVVSPVGGKGKPPPPPTSVPESQDEDRFIADWKKRLEKWVAGERLTQQPANALRMAIVSALNRAIDWNALCMKPVPAKTSLIELPNALGNPQTDRKLVIAEDAKDSDASLRQTLLAFLRYDYHGQTWTYPEADEDTAWIANAIDRLLPLYLEMVFADSADEIEGLTTALNRQGQFLGIAPKRVSGRLSLNDAVFSAAPESGPGQFEPGSPKEKWHELRIEASAARLGLQELLKSKLAAFQGTGSTAYAIDAARLTLGKTDAFTKLKDLTAFQREHLSSLTSVKLRARSNVLLREINSLSDEIQKLTGPEFGKHETCAALQELVVAVEAGKVWPPTFSYKKAALLKQIERFRDAPIVELMKQMSEIGGETDNSEIEGLLHILGKIDLTLVNWVDRFLKVLSEFLRGVEMEIKQEEKNSSGIDIDKIAAEVEDVLNNLKATFDELSGGNCTS